LPRALARGFYNRNLWKINQPTAGRL